MVRPPEAVLAPQVADLVVSEGKNKLLDTHRRYIVAQGVFEVAKAHQSILGRRTRWRTPAR